MENFNNNVRIVSSDDVYFDIPEEVAKQSQFLSILLNKKYPFVEGIERTFNLPIISHRLETAIEYLKYKHTYHNAESEIPQFSITREEAADLLEISAYLKC